MQFRYTIAGHPKSALFLAVPTTTTLFKFAHAADLTIKQVTSFQQAVDCGGILLVASNGNWTMLAGRALHRTLQRGEDILTKMRIPQWSNKWRQGHQKVMAHGGGWRHGKCCGGNAVVEPTDTLFDHLPVGEAILVLGVITKAHGYGYGHPAEVYGESRQRWVNVGIAPVGGTGWIGSPTPTWPPVGGQIVTGPNSTYGPYIKSHSWTLHTELDFGLARDHFMKNKAEIMAKWASAMTETELIPYYEATYDAAVQATFAETQHLVAQIPFVGGTVSPMFDSDMRIISGLPVLDTGSALSEGGESYFSHDQPVRTAKELMLQNISMFPDFGYDCDVPMSAMVQNANFSTTIVSAPKDLVIMEGVVLPLRELVGAISPRAGLEMVPVTGTLDTSGILAKYTAFSDYKSGTSLDATITTNEGAEAYALTARTALDLGNSLYLGNLASSMFKMSKNWDILTQESV